MTRQEQSRTTPKPDSGNETHRHTPLPRSKGQADSRCPVPVARGREPRHALPGGCAPARAGEVSVAATCGGQRQMGSNPASPVAAGEPGGALRSSADWEYAPAPESRDIVSIHGEYGLFIGGEFTAPLSGEHFGTVNPASEETLARVAQAGQADVDRAVATA